MLRIFKCLLLPFLLAVVTQSSTVSAESIRLTGPDSELRATSRYSDLTSGQRRNVNEPSRFYGPTTSQETLWSIASRLRPSASITVQQTLFAIYQLNPQAFANQNIHELIPGSTLRIPSLAQAQGVSTQEAVNIMAAHQARLSGTAAPTVRRPQSQATVSPQVVEAEAKELQQDTMAKEPMVEESSEKPKSSLEKIVQREHKNQVTSLEKQLENSEDELLALEEKNHKLRLMLADVQSEVDVLKDELGDESRIRSEVEKLIEAERERLAEEQRLKPTALDDLLSSTAFVAAMAIIPGLLIGLVLMTLLGRRKKDAAEQPQAAASAEPAPEPTAPVAPPPIDDDVEDDLLLDDDLFGESSDEEQLFSDELEEGASDEEDVFADLEENDLDFNLEGEDGEDPFAGIGDDGELDESLAELDETTDGLGGDEELGLDEMERALDDVVADGDESDDAFDLSEESDDIAQDELDSLLAADGESEDLGTDELDQSLLDDLFSESDSGDDLDFDSLVDEPEDSDSESSDDVTDTLDELLDEGGDTEQPGETDLLDEALSEESVDVSDDSTDLLDELIDEGGDTELPGETDLLDEALSEGSVDVSDDSTDLLDELIDE
ncbi:FimV/HubP family polar landmark protein, partial [Vibrio sp.]|uniref:FimV/HubP family polar landmark protein n=1 Tax=Vibrio sp. TaxID=678 RepID=UPI00311E0818